VGTSGAFGLVVESNWKEQEGSFIALQACAPAPSVPMQ